MKQYFSSEDLAKAIIAAQSPNSFAVQSYANQLINQSSSYYAYGPQLSQALSRLSISPDFVNNISSIENPVHLNAFVLTLNSRDLISCTLDNSQSMHSVEIKLSSDNMPGIVISPVSTYVAEREALKASIKNDYLSILKEAAQIAPYEFYQRFDEQECDKSIDDLNDYIFCLETDKRHVTIKVMNELIQYVKYAKTIKVSRPLNKIFVSERLNEASASDWYYERIAIAALFPNLAKSPNEPGAIFAELGYPTTYNRNPTPDVSHPIRIYSEKCVKKTEDKISLRSCLERYANKAEIQENLSVVSSHRHILDLAKIEYQSIMEALTLSWFNSKDSIYNAFVQIQQRMHGAAISLGGF